MERNVICMTTDEGKKHAFVVVGDAQDIISKLKAGVPHFPNFTGGFEAQGTWREKLLHEYSDTMEDTYGPGHWEYPGIYVPNNPKVTRFCKDCYQPDYILGKWYGDAEEIIVNK